MEYSYTKYLENMMHKNIIGCHNNPYRGFSRGDVKARPVGWHYTAQNSGDGPPGISHRR